MTIELSDPPPQRARRVVSVLKTCESKMIFDVIVVQDSLEVTSIMHRVAGLPSLPSGYPSRSEMSYPPSPRMLRQDHRRSSNTTD